MLWSSAGQRACVGVLLRLRAVRTGAGTHTCPCRLLYTSRSPERVPEPLRRWTVAVDPFGTVRAQLACSISVVPLDPHSFPDADRAVITVRGTEEEEVSVGHLRAHYDDRSKELLISAEDVNSSVSVELAAPIRNNLHITVHGKGSVQVKNMECDTCEVRMETGNCLLHSVKAHQVEVQSCGGNVTGVGTIHGNVDINARGHGAVDVKKLQGNKMTVSTEHGPLNVKAVYSESSCMSSSSGRIELGHVHGDTAVTNVSGDTVVDGSNSLLKVLSHSGSIDVYVGDGSAELHSQEGSVFVRVTPLLRAGVELCGASVDIGPEVPLRRVAQNTTEGQTTVTGYMNAETEVAKWVKARADRGAVTLKTQSWFESLKLGS
ncbi:protein FAM185A [Thalassophryne amazonica]|uniref:protein FAM185A n=1 Tax=Thalassophryne amazonica TaxID=390379 RepID=UPI00147179CD|nr:protein FAM185A [Thalassophryne amazonica]